MELTDDQGGSIGAGLFVGSGGALGRGGPASLLLCFAIIGVMIFNTVYALGELAVMYPVCTNLRSRSFSNAVRFLVVSTHTQFDSSIHHGDSRWGE